jgi:hypothetical protein
VSYMDDHLGEDIGGGPGHDPARLTPAVTIQAVRQRSKAVCTGPSLMPATSSAARSRT